MEPEGVEKISLQLSNKYGAWLVRCLAERLNIDGKGAEGLVNKNSTLREMCKEDPGLRNILSQIAFVKLFLPTREAVKYFRQN